MNILKGVKNNSMMLLTLINDLMDLAKDENLTFQFNNSKFNLLESINQTFDTLRFISDSRKIKTSIEVKPENEKFFQNMYGD